MSKYLILAIALVLTACSKKVDLQFDGKHYYQVVEHRLVAFDGADWYQLVSPEFPLDKMATLPEEWMMLTYDEKSVGSKYRRTLATKNNTNLPPIFVEF